MSALKAENIPIKPGFIQSVPSSLLTSLKMSGLWIEWLRVAGTTRGHLALLM
jgi:hypothetical protein